jgi:hypothetical protein
MNKFPYKKKQIFGDSIVYELDQDGHIFNAVDKFKFQSMKDNMDLKEIAKSNDISLIDLNSLNMKNFEYPSNTFSKIIINQINKISPSEYEIDISPLNLKKNPAFLSSTFFYSDKWYASVNNIKIPNVNIDGFSGWAIEPNIFIDNENLILKIKHSSQDIFNILFYLAGTLFSIICFFILSTNGRVRDD